jgi:tRNA(Ile)-lysidine synthase
MSMNKTATGLDEKFYEFIGNESLIDANENVLVTVSGGVDSSVMLDLFSKSEYRFGIAHCNFQLRGEESDDDEKFVTELSRKYKRPFHVIRFDTAKYAKENKLSVQMAARKLRYDWFEKLSQDFGYDKIATGHHVDDAIETMIIYQMRNHDDRRMKSIPVRNGKVIRPMLFLMKKEIESYASVNKIIFREDSSNNSDKYLRNSIRHHIIPMLEAKDESFRNTMIEHMTLSEEIQAQLEDQEREWKEKYVYMDSKNYHHIPVEPLMKLDDPAYFLENILKMYDHHRLECKKILSVKSSGKLFHMPGWDILADRNEIILRKKSKKAGKEIEVEKFPAKIKSCGSVVTFAIIEPTDKLNLSDKDFQFIDASKIKLPLKMRSWKNGDYFFPFGMNGKKKVSDFYTDIKLNLFEKEDTMLLLSGNDIVSILGHRIDDRYKISDTTKRVLKITTA